MRQMMMRRRANNATNERVRHTYEAHLALVALTMLTILVASTGCTPAAGGGRASATPTSRVPTATLTARQRVAALAQQSTAGMVQSVMAAFGSDGSGGTQDGLVTLTATVDGPVPGTVAEIAASQERVKAICFHIEEALWTSGMPLSEVTVDVVGPIYDDYADLTTGAYGAAVLKTAAAKLDWAHLSPDTAWDTYGVWLRPAYRSKVLGK